MTSESNGAAAFASRQREGPAELPVQAVDADTLERLALAIAKPGTDALVIDRDNRAAGRTSIREATRSGRAFAVIPDDDIIALDVDDGMAADWVRRNLPAILGKRRIPFVVANSGRLGNLHVFARVHDSASKQEIETAAKVNGCDIRANQRIRPPLSPHRLGLPVSLITPATVAEALSALRSTDAPYTGRIRKGRGISGRIFALLRDGDRDGRYRTRSELIWAIAVAAVNQNYSEQWLFDELRNPNNRGGEKVQERPEADARSYVARTFRKARAFVAANPPFGNRGAAAADIVGRIDRAEPAMLAATGAGQAGATDAAVLIAHMTIARRIGSLEHGASTREIAELAGVSLPSVLKAHRRLSQGAFLKRVSRPPVRATTASQWFLRLPSDSAAGFNSHTPIGGGVRETVKADHTCAGADIWRRVNGLGKAKFRVWALLTPPRTAKELAGKLNIKPRTIRDHLRGLEEHGLCSRDADGRWRCENAVNLNALAETLGCAGAGKRQHALHEAERENFRRHVA